MTSGIIEILIEDTNVQAVVGRDDMNQVKVYPVIAPQGVEVPYVIVSEEQLNPSMSKGCPSLDSPRYNVMVYSTDFRETEVIQNACRDCLDSGQSFVTDAGVRIEAIYMVDRRDLWAQAQGENGGLYVKMGVYAAEINREL